MVVASDSQFLDDSQHSLMKDLPHILIDDANEAKTYREGSTQEPSNQRTKATGESPITQKTQSKFRCMNNTFIRPLSGCFDASKEPISEHSP